MEELLSYANGIAKEKHDRPLSGSAMPTPKAKNRINMQQEMDHAGALARLNEGLRLALEQANGDPATLAWLIGATLLSLGQQGYLDKQVTATVATVLGKSGPAQRA